MLSVTPKVLDAIGCAGNLTCPWSLRYEKDSKQQSLKLKCAYVALKFGKISSIQGL